VSIYHDAIRDQDRLMSVVNCDKQLINNYITLVVIQIDIYTAKYIKIIESDLGLDSR